MTDDGCKKERKEVVGVVTDRDGNSWVLSPDASSALVDVMEMTNGAPGLIKAIVVDRFLSLAKEHGDLIPMDDNEHCKECEDFECPMNPVNFGVVNEHAPTGPVRRDN